MITIEDEISKYEKSFEKEYAKYSVLKDEISAENIELKEKKENQNELIAAEAILKNLINKNKQPIIDSLEGIITEAFIECGYNNRQFKIKNDDGEISFVIRKKINGEFVDINTKNGSGGTLLDIYTIILRLCYAELYTPLINGPFVLDEFGRMISENIMENFAPFIKKLLLKMNRQAIVVTHSDAIKNISDKTFFVEQNNNISMIKEV